MVEANTIGLNTKKKEHENNSHTFGIKVNWVTVLGRMTFIRLSYWCLSKQWQAYKYQKKYYCKEIWTKCITTIYRWLYCLTINRSYDTPVSNIAVYEYNFTKWHYYNKFCTLKLSVLFVNLIHIFAFNVAICLLPIQFVYLSLFKLCKLKL